MALATAIKPTVTHEQGSFISATFDGKNAALTSALLFAKEHGLTLNHCVSPPSLPDQPGFQRITAHPRGYLTSADGILVKTGQSAGMYSRDCPIAAVMDTVRNEAVLLHCGRGAMSPTQYLMNRQYNIITAGLAVLKDRNSKLSDISVWITGGICNDCFTHDLVRDHALLAPFESRHPLSVNPETGGLDLVGIICSQLRQAGVNGPIEHDGLCTKEHPRLASKRGGDNTDASNFVFLSLK